MRAILVSLAATTVVLATPRPAAAWSCYLHHEDLRTWPLYGEIGPGCALIITTPGSWSQATAGDLRLRYQDELGATVEIPFELHHERLELTVWYSRCGADCQYNSWSEPAAVHYYELLPLELLPAQTQVTVESSTGEPWARFDVGPEDHDVCGFKGDVTDPYCSGPPCENDPDYPECAADDPPVGDQEEPGEGGGCSSTGAGAGPWLLLALTIAVPRRRRT